MNNSAITNEFVDAWEARDIEKILGFFTDDAVYTNIPMGPPNEGIAAIREFIEGFLSMVSDIKFVVHHQVEGENGIVMNERTDTITMNGKSIALPVMGIFEFRNGKISAWRDYFDMALFAE